MSKWLKINHLHFIKKNSCKIWLGIDCDVFSFGPLWIPRFHIVQQFPRCKPTRFHLYNKVHTNFFLSVVPADIFNFFEKKIIVIHEFELVNERLPTNLTRIGPTLLDYSIIAWRTCPKNGKNFQFFLSYT